MSTTLSRGAGRVVAAAVPLLLVVGTAGGALAAPRAKTPAPTLTATPAAITSSRTASFAWTTPAPPAGTSYTFSCALDGAKPATCASPQAYGGLADGAHTFVVKTQASTGGKPSGTSFSWRVDTVAPAAPVVDPVAGPTSNTSAVVSWSDADASVTGFTCALDGAAAQPCTSPTTLTGLAEGTHTVVVTASDAAGNTASGSTGWVVDATAPSIPSVAGPTSPTRATDAVVTFSGGTGDLLSCDLDGTPVQPCTSPVVLSGLAEGTHAFTVTPTDAAGNVGTPGVATWVVDLTPPAAPVLVSAPAATTSNPDFTVRFAGSDLTTAGFTCAFAGTTAPCTSPWTPSLTPVDGPYALQVRALDTAGNASAPLDVAWAFDATAPAPAAFVSGPGTPTADTAPAFDFVATDPSTASFLCALDGAAAAVCQPGDAFPATGDGSHVLAVQAVDAVGNASSPVTWSWLLDTTAPQSAPKSAGVPADSGTVSTTPSFSFSSSDPAVAGFVCSVDGGAFVACGSPYTPAVGDGAHTLVVATVDAAGNRSSDTLTYSWVLDGTAPQATAALPTSLAGTTRVVFSEDVLGVAGGTVGLAVVGGSAVPAAVGCLSAGATAVPCTGPVRTAVVTPAARLVPGQRYQVVLGAVHDAAGNVAVLPPTSFRGGLTVQDSDPSMAQAWTQRASSSASGGRYVVARLVGATAQYRFSGTAVTWYTTTGPTQGTVRVYLDGVYKGTVNNWASGYHWRVPRTLSRLAAGPHVLRLTVTGARGSSAGKDTQVIVDAVKVGSTTVTNPVLSTSWAGVSASAASGRRYAVADLPGDAVSLAFRGTRITWSTVAGPSMGRAQVFVDGVYKGTFDNWAATTRYGVQRSWAVADGLHTVRVVALGTHRSGATGSRVAVDALTVG